ncbi:MAG: hypothetical protein NC331_16480 [Lachnospiraceae bacterium]|nr:hypothetical protein [Lachnospiraceae bacterium]MCM1240947.1 hypothetical protein [Lachnospiraceae bacterium]
MRHPACSRIIKILLIVLAALAALKILFVGYDLDEQYALSMSYRLLKGDCPIRDMWEPHQTSAFLASFLMLPYIALTGSTAGIVLYLRALGLAVHSLTAFLLYRQTCSLFEKYTAMEPGFRRDVSLLLTCVYFFSLPKLMFFPEFSNMQLWFLLLMVLCISHYYTQILSGRKVFSCWLAGAGLCLSLEALSYPSSLLLFPACVYFLFRCRKLSAGQAPASGVRRSVIRELSAFCFPCIVAALLFVGGLLTRMTWGELTALLPLAASDGSHAFSLADKLLLNGRSLLEILCFFVVYGLISLVISLPLRKRYLSRDPHRSLSAGQNASFPALWSMILLSVTLLGQILIWILGDRYPNYPSVEYFFVPILASALISHRSGPEKMLSFLFVVLPLTAFAGILLLTNHPLLVSAPFLGICAMGALLCLFLHIKKTCPLLRTVLLLWAVTLLFGKCYMIRTTGGTHYTLFHPVSLMREGPAACIMADTETVRRYRDSLDLLRETLPGHSKVFYIGTANGIYLMGDMEFCTPSTISSPTFDEKTEAYFALHPEKYPEYIICDAELASLDGDGFLPGFLRKNCVPEPISENDFLVIYRTVDSPAP